MNKLITKNNFKTEVMDTTALSLVHFKTEWSGTCQIISPVYEDLAQSYHGMVNFFSIDIEQEKGIDAELGIRELPTILFFKAGKVVDYVTGLTPKNILIEKIENALL